MKSKLFCVATMVSGLSPTVERLAGLEWWGQLLPMLQMPCHPIRLVNLVGGSFRQDKEKAERTKGKEKALMGPELKVLSATC